MNQNTKTDNEEKIVKKRGEYSTKRKKELENLLSAAKEFQFNQKKENVKFKRNPASIAEFTKDTCLYPARYLDNDNTCVKCDIYEYCACKLKNLGKRKKNE
jgi:hypothetical protein